MSRQTAGVRTQLTLNLMRETTEPPVISKSKDLLEALADLLLAALNPEGIKLGEKEGKDDA
jgi:hypothetical protein